MLYSTTARLKLLMARLLKQVFLYFTSMLLGRNVMHLACSDTKQVDKFTSWAGGGVTFNAAKSQVERRLRILVATTAVVGVTILITNNRVDAQTGNSSGDREDSEEDTKVSTKDNSAAEEDGWSDD